MAKFLLVSRDPHFLKEFARCYPQEEQFLFSSVYEDAIRKIESENISFVVIDRSFSFLGTIILVQQIRKRHFAPVILLATGAENQNEKEIAIGIGADDYLEKPFKMESVRPLIDSWMQNT